MTFRFKRLYENTRSKLKAEREHRRVAVQVESHQVAGFLSEVRVSLTGWSDPRGFLGLDDDARAGLQEIRGTVHLTSSAGPHDIARLQHEVERHCPVLDDLRSPVPVSMTVETRSAIIQEE